MEESGIPSFAPFIGVIALIAWVAYRRVRRLVSRQRLSPVRPIVTAGLFALLLVLLLIGSLANLDRAVALMLGSLLGAALGHYGLRLTKFENTDSGIFYTPNGRLGIALSLLFVGRIAYRAFQLYLASDTESLQAGEFMSTPLTLAIFGMLAGYYVYYEIGLVRHARGYAVDH